MTKPEMLTLLRLLSSVETALLCHKVTLPDQLWETLADATEKLEREVLG